MRALRILGGCLLLALATPAVAQSGQLPPPPPPAVSQSEPGYGPLRDLHQALVVRQADFNRKRQYHITHCQRIPPNDTARINWCRANVGTLAQERKAYQFALQEYEAKQAYYQGRTLYIRKDYDGAIAKYETAQRLLPASSRFEGDVRDELDLARGRKELSAGRGASANNYLLSIERRANDCPTWLRVEVETLLVDFKLWVKQQRKKLEIRTPAAVCAVRG